METSESFSRPNILTNACDARFPHLCRQKHYPVCIVYIWMVCRMQVILVKMMLSNGSRNYKSDKVRIANKSNLLIIEKVLKISEV